MTAVTAPQHRISKIPREIDLDVVEFTPYNPKQRRANVESLAESIKADGQLEPAHLVFDPVRSAYILADGNRRATALKANGASTIRALVYEAKDPKDTRALVDFLFTALNVPKMTLKNGQMLQAALAGGPTFNATVRSSLSFLTTHFNAAEIEGLLKNGNVTPTLLSTAKRIATYCVPGVGKDTSTYVARVRKTLWWLLRNETQQEAIAYMRLGYSSEAMRRAIDADQEHLPRMAPPKQKAEKKSSTQPTA